MIKASFWTRTILHMLCQSKWLQLHFELVIWTSSDDNANDHSFNLNTLYTPCYVKANDQSFILNTYYTAYVMSKQMITTSFWTRYILHLISNKWSKVQFEHVICFMLCQSIWVQLHFEHPKMPMPRIWAPNEFHEVPNKPDHNLILNVRCQFSNHNYKLDTVWISWDAKDNDHNCILNTIRTSWIANDKINNVILKTKQTAYALAM